MAVNLLEYMPFAQLLGLEIVTAEPDNIVGTY